MAEKLSYNVIFHSRESFLNFQNSMMAESVQPLCLMPYSRVKRYELTDHEVELLKNDPNIKKIEPTIDRLPVEIVNDWKIDEDWIQSGRWYRGYGEAGTYTASDKNWALYRCYRGEQPPANASGQYWGITATSLGADRSEFHTLIDSIDISATGKNVDIVIVDSGHVPPHYFEFQKNSDGTGGSRVIEYNWNQHWGEIIGDPSATLPPTSYFSSMWGDHATLCAGHAAGNTQGWAREANIYTFGYLYDIVDSPFAPASPMPYIAAFHRNKPINPQTGRKNPTIINNSWSYRYTDLNPWKQATEVWLDAGTRQVLPRQTPEAMRFYTPCISTSSSEPYQPNYHLSYLPPLSAVQNKLFDPAGVAAQNVKYAITTTNDLSGNKILSIPSQWTTSPYSNIPYKREITYSNYNISQVSNGRTFTVQGPCLLSLSITLDLRSADLTASRSITTRIEVYKGSELIHTETGKAGASSFLSIGKNLLDTEVYTITYKAINLSLPPGTPWIIEQGNISITNPDYNVVRTANWNGEVDNIPYDSQNITINFPRDNWNPDWKFLDYPLVGTSGSTSRGWQVDHNGLKFYTTGNLFTHLVLTGITTWEGSSGTTWFTNQHYSETITGSVGSRVAVIKHRFYLTAGDVQDWGGGVTQVLYRIFENQSNYMEIEIGQNQAYVAPAGTYPWQVWVEAGVIQSRLSAQVDSVLTEYEDGMDDGVISFGSAGNIPNTISCPDQPTNLNKIKFKKGEKDEYVSLSPTLTPGAAGGSARSLAIAATETGSRDRLTGFTQRGPAVGIAAPGDNLLGPTTNVSSLIDPRSTPGNQQYITLGTGTSFSSPTAAGIATLVAEKFPYFTQKEMKEYLENTAGKDQILEIEYEEDKWGKYKLRGMKNNYLRYREEREKNGIIGPSTKRSYRPESGILYPRRRSGQK